MALIKKYCNRLYFILFKVVGSNTMLKPLLNNAIVMDVGKSLMSSINDAYKAAELSSGAEWRSMDASEKFMRIFREIDLVCLNINNNFSILSFESFFFGANR